MTKQGMMLIQLPEATDQGLPEAASSPPGPDTTFLKDLLSSLERAGLSVVVVVGVEEQRNGGGTGATVSRAWTSLEGAGLSVVAQVRADRDAPARNNSPNLVLMRPEVGQLDLRAPHPEAPALACGPPVVVLARAADEAAARAALTSAGLGYMVTLGGDAGTCGEHPKGPEPWAYPPRPSHGGDRAAETPTDLLYGLTPREVEVLQYFANGALTNQVAKQLYVSPKTVKNHLAHIYAKLGVASRTQAIAIALRKGIVTIG